jgi:hypothetical protein
MKLVTRAMASFSLLHNFLSNDDFGGTVTPIANRTVSAFTTNKLIPSRLHFSYFSSVIVVVSFLLSPWHYLAVIKDLLSPNDLICTDTCTCSGYLRKTISLPLPLSLW